MKHVRLNLKKRKMQKNGWSTWKAETRQHGKAMVIGSPNPIFDEPPRTAKSININARRKRLMKINEENKTFETFQAVEPVKLSSP